MHNQLSLDINEDDSIQESSFSFHLLCETIYQEQEESCSCVEFTREIWTWCCENDDVFFFFKYGLFKVGWTWLKDLAVKDDTIPVTTAVPKSKWWRCLVEFVKKFKKTFKNTFEKNVK